MPEALILEFTGVGEPESSRAEQGAFMDSRLGAALAAGGVCRVSAP